MKAGTRRTHNKTRLGCSQCKKRRIKCDCTQPECDNCKKRGQQCSFLLLAPSTRLSVGTTSPVSPPSGTATGFPSASNSIDQPDSSALTIINPETPYEVQIYQPTVSRLSSRSPSQSPIIALPDINLPPAFSSISPPLKYKDDWKDAREALPPALQSLLYHYEYTTSLTLATHDPAKAAWQSYVPELAARHGFLVHHILAVAALHLGRLHGDGNERRTMENVGRQQINKAIGRYKHELENVHADNAAALFASATLTAVYFFRTSTLEIEEIRGSVPADTMIPHQNVIDQMLGSVLRTLGGLRGTLTVLIPGWRHVMGSKISPVAGRQWWPKDRSPATERAVEEDRRLAAIEEMWSYRNREPETDVDCLASALFYLRETFALVSQLTLPNTDFPDRTSINYAVDDTTVGKLKDRGAMFVWATRISRDFIKLLEQKNREALVIVAHFFILVGRIRNVWWLEGLGANMVIAVAMALGQENWHLIQWPVQVTGVDLHNAFTAWPDKLVGKPGEMLMAVI